ncbi:probable serine/threonine-protein kinase clkA isoform X2 [Lucilia cuprina]|uniref:probable serine/threonine-protein kinase clkA isoform X2 n=1 Tax=Lucilia cuprina TaxID=7375 RepID=UPI001F06D2E1|nr:probable serine/threonine-protein kinase clkA isoform X2 [Lucilia cuprina]
MSNYFKKGGVASSCKHILHCGDQCEGRCNRFTYTKHFKSKTKMVPLISLALSLMCYHNIIFVQGMLIDSNDFKTEIYSELTTTYMPQILLDPHISESKENVINKLNIILNPTPEAESYKNIKFEEKIEDKNIDIKSSIDYPAGPLTETIQNTTSQYSYPSPTLDNLNEQYENESKTESATIHMPQILLDTHILKIKEKSLDNFEKILTNTPEEELYNNIKHEEKIGYKNIENNSSVDSADSFNETIQNFSRKNSNTSAALENVNRLSASKSEKHFLSEKIVLENFVKDISENTYSSEDSFRQHQQIIQNFETNYSSDVSKYIFNQQELNKTFEISEINLPQNCMDSVCEVNTTKFDVHIIKNNSAKFNNTKVVESASEITNDLPNITYTPLSYESIDFVTQNNDSNYNDNILSVDLHETISISPKNSNETDVLNITEYPKLYFEEVTEEIENANDSCVDEHVVIKKVLVEQDVIEYSFNKTTYPDLQNDEKNLLQLTYTDQNAQENKTKNGRTNKNYTLDSKTINEHTKSNALDSENITDCTSVESSEENTFNDYQSTEVINQYKNNVVKNESMQHLEQDNFINLNKEVDELLWKSGEERSMNELRHEKPAEDETNQYNKTDKYNDIGTKKFENNTYLFNQIENEQYITRIEKNNNENHETHEVRSTTLKTINESEAFESNISEIDITDSNNTTEKYENNYNIFIIKNEQIVQSNLTKPVNDYNSVTKQVTPLLADDIAATLFEAYPPQDVGQTFNDNLADESVGFGKALPISITEGFNRSTIIIAMNIEMQERNCGKDDLDDEDAQTFAKLLEVELPPSVAVALDECEECL